MIYVAYCPMETCLEDVLKNHGDKLKNKKVLLVERGKPKLVEYIDNRADSYGHDLYMFEIKFISSGKFN